MQIKMNEEQFNVRQFYDIGYYNTAKDAMPQILKIIRDYECFDDYEFNPYVRNRQFKKDLIFGHFRCLVAIDQKYDRDKYFTVRELEDKQFFKDVIEKCYVDIKKKRQRRTIQSCLKYFYNDIFLKQELLDDQKYKDKIKKIKQKRQEKERQIQGKRKVIERSIEQEKEGADFALWCIQNQIETGKRRIPATKNGVQKSNSQKLKFAYIYSIQIGGQIVYIGSTRRAIEERLGQHIACALDERDGGYQSEHLYQAMKVFDYRFKILFKAAEGVVNQTQLEAMECGFIQMWKPMFNYEGVKVPYKFTVDKKGELFNGEENV